MRIAGIVCADCGEQDLFAVNPGQAGTEDRERIADLFPGPEEPVRGWCFVCWSKHHWTASLPVGKPRVRRRAGSRKSL